MPVEIVPQPDQPDLERRVPELRLIQGGGEIAIGETVRPELYVVPDSPEAPGETIDSVEGDAAGEARLLRAAGEAGSRVLSGSEGIKKTGVTEPSLDLDEVKYKGGGGGWLIREYMRKQQAKEARAKAQAEGHEYNCDCPTCSSADASGT
jgi:hypothetical protein